MARDIFTSLAACVASFLLCAVVYPAVVLGVGRLAFPENSEGRLVKSADGTVIGSDLIAQPFSQDKYFHPRPSAAGSNGYAADAASGSNLGSKNPVLRSRMVLDVARLAASDGNDAKLKALLDRLDAKEAELKAKTEAGDKDAVVKLEADVASAQSEILESLTKGNAASKALIPADLVTTSGSGLDPDISPEAAKYQAPRVAAARKLTLERVQALIDSRTDHSGALLGAPPSVNVLRLNLLLDRESNGR